jgi:hypothetical protein
MRTDRQTVIMRKQTVTFRNFANASKMGGRGGVALPDSPNRVYLQPKWPQPFGLQLPNLTNANCEPSPTSSNSHCKHVTVFSVSIRALTGHGSHIPGLRHILGGDSTLQRTACAACKFASTVTCFNWLHVLHFVLRNKHF